MNRQTNYPIHPLLLARESTRAFSEERFSEDDLMSLFEAARWAPSSYNNQPWRFHYGRRDTPEWDLFFNPLVEFNKNWCRKADTLIAVISYQLYEYNHKPAPTAHFDSGSAWMSLALEAQAKGWVAHAMSGFDYEKLRDNLKVPNDYSIEAMIAVGKKGKGETLPDELRKHDTSYQRKSLQDIICKGTFRS